MNRDCPLRHRTPAIQQLRCPNLPEHYRECVKNPFISLATSPSRPIHKHLGPNEVEGATCHPVIHCIRTSRLPVSMLQPPFSVPGIPITMSHSICHPSAKDSSSGHPSIAECQLRSQCQSDQPPLERQGVRVEPRAKSEANGTTRSCCCRLRMQYPIEVQHDDHSFRNSIPAGFFVQENEPSGAIQVTIRGYTYSSTL